MKLKDLVSVAENKKNKQINFSLKKKEMKEVGISPEDLLDIKINKDIFR